MLRAEISELIFRNIENKKENLKKQFSEHINSIGYFYLDDLLPIDLVNRIHTNFPQVKETVLKKSLKEHKYVAFQMNNYHPLLEEVIYAFQDKRVVAAISEISGINNLFSDDNLYAGGLSIMDKGKFLNPHLDNSHDKDRNRWRVLNLLFYVTPNWKLENGGNLELWPNGLKEEPVTILSKFNRLVVMVTHQNSWHSVSKVIENDTRCCVSNYYFSERPVLSTDEFHVTSFRGRKNQKIRDTILQIDNKLRMGIRSIFRKGIVKNPHEYKK